MRRVRRLLKWAIVALGIAALARWWRERSSAAVTPSQPPPVEPAADPAEELRQKLAESRPQEASAAAEGTVDERRAEVHAEAREAIDEMRSSTEDE